MCRLLMYNMVHGIYVCVLNEARIKYWPISGRKQIKSTSNAMRQTCAHFCNAKQAFSSDFDKYKTIAAIFRFIYPSLLFSLSLSAVEWWFFSSLSKINKLFRLHCNIVCMCVMSCLTDFISRFAGESNPV